MVLLSVPVDPFKSWWLLVVFPAPYAPVSPLSNVSILAGI